MAGFFSVIEELYPRKVVVEQLNSFTPHKHTGVSSKSLLRQYDKLDEVTRQAFNQTFLQNIEQISVGQLLK